MNTGDACGDTKGHDAHSIASLQGGLTRLDRNGRSQEHGINAGPISLLGLQHFHAPAQKTVFGQRRGNSVSRFGGWFNIFLLSCQHGGRNVIKWKDGKPKVLVSEWDGKKFNSPNDIAVRSDGSLWFTDPSYGLKGREAEIDGKNVYRFDPKSGDLTLQLL